MKTPIVVAALCLTLPVAPAAAQVVYSIAYSDAGSLVSLEAEGVVVRHIGTSEALIEGDARLGGELRARGRIVERVVELGRWEDLYLCYPAAGLDELARAGEVLWIEPDGAVLVGASPGAAFEIRRASFMAYPLPASVAVASWFDDTPPPPLRVAMERDERRVRGLVDDVIEAVSTDSLMAHVERLSEYPDGELRGRYAYRSEQRTEIVPYLMDALDAYLPAGAVVDTQNFELNGFVCGDTTQLIEPYTMQNIVGVLPGSGRLGGYYIICGHYDATAVSTPEFEGDPLWWCDNPAPGANDNGTGVATVLEAARVLADVEFAFDLHFVLFDAEEQGLYGSNAFVDSAVARGDTIYGVINVDMIGYKLDAAYPDTSHIVTNKGTRWLADWLVDTAETVYAPQFDDFYAHRIDRALAYSDHAPFWIAGYDALVAIENWNPRDRFPCYHTVCDTFENVSPSQVTNVAKMVAGATARLLDPDSLINLAVFPEDFRFTPDDLITTGETTVRVDVHVFGPEESVDLVLEVWDGEPDEGELLSSFEEERVMGGGEVVTHEFDWEFGESDVGDHVVTARVIAEGTDELTLSDNEASVVVRVNAPSLFVLNHFTYPNPANAMDELNFRYELSRESESAVLDVYDVTGQALGTCTKYRSPSGSEEDNEGTNAGWNTIPWEDFTGSASELASGFYVYRLRCYGEGATDATATEMGRFAIVR
jgi:hypothetical protein